MLNSNYDYKYQYEQWHTDTLESKFSDINGNKSFITLHNILPHNPNAKILEIGCGMGRFMITLKEFGFNNILGIDIDKSQIEISKKENLNVKLTDASAFLEQNNEIYDVIYCIDILEHIEKDKQLPFLKEINKHLSDDGFLVIRVPNALAPTAMMYRYEDFTHNVSYTSNTINFLCKNASMNYISTRPEYLESKELQILKKPFADIYRLQFGKQNFILTPNIVSVIFKDKSKYNDYVNKTPIIENDYNDIDERIYFNPMLILKMYINYYRYLVLSKITFGKTKKHYITKILKINEKYNL